VLSSSPVGKILPGAVKWIEGILHLLILIGFVDMFPIPYDSVSPLGSGKELPYLIGIEKDEGNDTGSVNSNQL
jgi:hypothetical protein